MVEFGEMETHPGLVPRRERNAKPQIDGCDERRPLRPLVDHRVLAHQNKLRGRSEGGTVHG